MDDGDREWSLNADNPTFASPGSLPRAASTKRTWGVVVVVKNKTCFRAD
ncbi:hypothetical protein PLANPX_5257 [Lacipirellula parvula]|uniref:Uncharacterized protein n=1 Tax=Lacipirellula parvula TaxID=2650471 RepID=A0A5K7XGX8_9BACT|nr:hypothetical protein PLANPX_5257 [Lacipirellula parvula]